MIRGYLEYAQTELELLEAAWRAGKPELVLISGKLRSGKTHLIRQFMAGKNTLYLSVTCSPPKSF